MPTCRVLAFDDPDPFQSVLHGADNEVLVTSRGRFHADLTQIELPRMRLQRCSESLPAIKVGSLDAGQFGISFLTDPGQPELHHCGLVVRHGDIVIEDASLMHRRSDAPCRWGSLSMRADDLTATFQALSGHDLRAWRTHVIRPDPILFSRLTDLSARAGRMAHREPFALNDPGAAHALDEALATALACCLVDEENDSRARTPRGRPVIAQLERFLAKHQDEPIYIAELCAATHATERALRAACHEHLGMGAIQYLWLRRMHMARRLILRPSQNATVTEIATQCGFWELGRFSVQYQRLFGEAPSVTLHLAGREDRADARRVRMA
jgi:AraC-like DNA-binding protein